MIGQYWRYFLVKYCGILFKLTPSQFLDPSIHTAAHAFALQPQIKRYRTILQHLTPRDRQPLQNLVGAMCLFLETFDKYQIRYLGKQCREIIKALPLFAKALGEVSLSE